MNFYTIATEFGTATVQAKSLDEAARMFAEMENLEFTTYTALKAYFDAQGSFIKIHESDSSPTTW